MCAKKAKIFPTDRNNATDKNFNIRCVVSIRWAIVFKPVWLRLVRVVAKLFDFFLMRMTGCSSGGLKAKKSIILT